MDLNEPIMNQLELVDVICEHPIMHRSNLDNGDVLIEWMWHKMRLGFCITSNPEKSTWYLISGKGLGCISTDGYLFEQE